MLIISVVGARPNFMKMAPVIDALKEFQIENKLVHTGQHYDWNMSKSFFKDLGLPEPDKYLKIGSGNHGDQTGRIIIEFEKYCLETCPDLVIVAGDVNSTLGCSLVASKLGIKIAHIESGLRSFDRSMPEEINRLITDQISDLLFVTEKSGKINLTNEGIDPRKIHFVGNCMIDTLKKFYKSSRENKPYKKFGVKENDYVIITMHRPSNVDSITDLRKYIKLFNEMSERIPFIFPMHPRTKNIIDENKIKIDKNIRIVEPLSYRVFLGLLSNCKMVFTDSGGIQEETTYLNIQCITIRDNTERPITVELGTNHLVGTNPKVIKNKFNQIMNGEIKRCNIPPQWDGKTGQRIASIINDYLKI